MGSTPLEGRRQPAAATDPQPLLLAYVGVASRPPETFAVAASSVRLTLIASNQDRSNYRREEDVGRHDAACVIPTSKSVPLPNRSARTTSPGMTRISRTLTPNRNPTSNKSHHNVRRKLSMVKYAQISKKIRKIAAQREYRTARELSGLSGLARFSITTIVVSLSGVVSELSR